MEDLHSTMRMNDPVSSNHRTAAPRTRARRAIPETPIVRPGDDQIRARAYQIYLRRDGRPGDPIDDWFCAERELIEEAPAPPAPSSRKRKARS
jgi:Protein of unknown function (DUF2934)